MMRGWLGWEKIYKRGVGIKHLRDKPLMMLGGLGEKKLSLQGVEVKVAGGQGTRYD